MIRYVRRADTTTPDQLIDGDPRVAGLRGPEVCCARSAPRLIAGALAALVAAINASPVRAAGLADNLIDSEVVSFAFSGGLALFAAVVAFTYLGERPAWGAREAALSEELADV
ncbi:MAG: hypothetical protein N2444_08070, partial [Methylocystis sp.]|nr:hypothetical protein [Methylocystis sp.]